MAHLSDDRLFTHALPGRWRPLLELLRQVDLLPGRQQAAGLESEMLREARHLEEDLPESLRASSPLYRRWFTEAALLWPFFADAGGPVLLDTVGTTTLNKYPVDFQPAGNDYPVLRRAVGEMFGWADEELRQIEDKLRKLTSPLRLKKALTRRLSSFFKSEDIGELKRLAAEFMRQVQGPLPWRPGDVDLVITQAAVFLCLPYEGTSLTVPDYDARPVEEREQISKFLERVHAAQQSLKSVRFPAFGLFDAKLVSRDLIHRLTKDIADEAAVAETFRTMVTILPSREIEKYLVHDVWGHGWQEALCEFEWTFRDLPKIGAPLAPAQLRDAFETKEGRTLLRPDALLRIVESDLRRRILVGLNLIVSEMLADLIEHKFSRQVSPLPSSSLLPDGPLRIDLSLKDTRLMVRAWRRAYRSLLRAAEREHLRDEWTGAGLPEEGLRHALEEAARLIDEHYGLAFEDSTELVYLASGGLRGNLLQRIMLGVIALDAALDRFLSEAETRCQAALSADPTAPRWRCPAASIDFIALLLGWFYEQERALHVWHLDELVTKELGPTLLRLEGAIAQQSGTERQIS